MQLPNLLAWCGQCVIYIYNFSICGLAFGGILKHFPVLFSSASGTVKYLVYDDHAQKPAIRKARLSSDSRRESTQRIRMRKSINIAFSALRDIVDTLKAICNFSHRLFVTGEAMVFITRLRFSDDASVKPAGTKQIHSSFGTNCGRLMMSYLHLAKIHDLRNATVNLQGRVLFKNIINYE